MKVVDLMNQLSCFKGRQKVFLGVGGLVVAGELIGVPDKVPKADKAPEKTADKAPEKTADKAPEKTATEKTDGG